MDFECLSVRYDHLNHTKYTLVILGLLRIFKTNQVSQNIPSSREKRPDIVGVSRSEWTRNWLSTSFKLSSNEVRQQRQNLNKTNSVILIGLERNCFILGKLELQIASGEKNLRTAVTRQNITHNHVLMHEKLLPS